MSSMKVTGVSTAAQAKATTAKAPKMSEFLVVLDDQADAKISKAFEMPMGIKRREYVFNALRENMQQQKPIWGFLDGLQATGHVAEYTPLWIQNAIVVRGDAEAKEALAHAANVGAVVNSQQHVAARPSAELTTSEAKAAAKAGQWNIDHVNAPAAWADGITGKDIVVANIDTGVDVTHPALLTNFRGYDAKSGSINLAGNWHDAAGRSPDKMVDEHGHGTHTTGTHSGSDGRTNKIGVAPDSKWFAVRGLGMQDDPTTPADETHSGSDGMLLRAFQYAVAPTLPAPGTAAGSTRALELGADVINNSWGDTNSLSTGFLAALRNMKAMGIVNVFSAGNDGSGGGSLGSPATSPDVIAVAATDNKNKTAGFSSRGPSPFGRDGVPSPFIAAPGVNVRSAVPGGGYETGWNGTSMAGPHVTGAVALVQDAAKQETGGQMLDPDAVADVLRRTTRDIAAKGIDAETGYGVLDLANLRQVVRDVVRERGLVEPAPAASK